VTGVVVRPVDKPQAEPIRAAFDRVQRCPNEIPDKFWPIGIRSRRRQSRTTPVSNDGDRILVLSSNGEATYPKPDETSGNALDLLAFSYQDNRQCPPLGTEAEGIHCWKDHLWPRRSQAGGDT